MYRLYGRELPLLHYLRAPPGHQGGLLVIYHRAGALGPAPGLAPAGYHKVRVEMLAVIDIAEGHRGRVRPPAVSGIYDHLLGVPGGALLKADVHLADGVHGVAVQVVVAVKYHVPLVPPRPQSQANPVFPRPKQADQVEGLVLQVKVVAVVARQQVLVPGLLAVDPELVYAKAADIGPGVRDLPADGEVLEQ